MFDNLLKMFIKLLKGSPYFSILDLRKSLIILKKGTAMTSNSTFSLSMQKQIQKSHITFDSEINRAFNELKFKSLLSRSGIVKQKGYSTVSILLLIVLLPFLKRTLSDFRNTNYIQNGLNAQKDSYYRFLNNERFNWRKLIYFVALKIITSCENVPLSEEVLIADDTIAPKTGKNMEFVSYHFDHKVHRSILGNQCLQLGYHNGINFFPIDVVFNTSSKRPNNNCREIDKRTNGWRRRKEALNKKTDALVQMIDRAWKSGINASFVLFDSWFAHDNVISQIYNIGYGVICRLKKGHVKYTYQGSQYTLKQLWQEVAKKKTKFIGKYQVKGVCLNTTLPKTGDVRILFVSDGKKQWHAFLCTDLELDCSEILDYYTRRWAIEVFFKDAKQMLYLGKEQSKAFDAVVASYSIVMLRYLLLVYIISKRRIIGPVGPLFRQISEKQLFLHMAEKMWAYVKELIVRSSHILCYKIEPDIVLHLLDIAEDSLFNPGNLGTAKL